jgi:hypothetical protein
MKIFKKKKYSLMSVLSKYSFVFIIAFSMMLPLVFVGAACKQGTGPGTSLACVDGGTGSDGGTGKDGGTGSDGGTGTGIKIDAGIENPIGGNIDTIPDFIRALIKIVLTIGIPLLALAIIYAGFLYVKAQGNPGELEVAHRTLLYTIIGGALLLGAFVIANAIGSTVKDIERTT